MKRLTIVALVTHDGLLFNAYEKEAPIPEPTTYTVKKQLSTVIPTASIIVDFTAFEYNEIGEKIATNNVEEVTAGCSRYSILSLNKTLMLS